MYIGQDMTLIKKVAFKFLNQFLNILAYNVARIKIYNNLLGVLFVIWIYNIRY